MEETTYSTYCAKSHHSLVKHQCSLNEFGDVANIAPTTIAPRQPDPAPGVVDIAILVVVVFILSLVVVMVFVPLVVLVVFCVVRMIIWHFVNITRSFGPSQTHLVEMIID